MFISYRRSDSLHAARRIRDKLAIAFGAQVVFIDEGSLIAGDDFPEAIRFENVGAGSIVAQASGKVVPSQEGAPQVVLDGPGLAYTC